MLKIYSTLIEDIQAKNALRIFYLKEKLYKTISIDIIMPTYNRLDSISKAITSVLDQTHPKWNLYIWDDGSSDNTKNYLNQYSSDPRIHYSHSFPNKGVSFARNQCLNLGKSDIITYLDSDNQWDPDYLQIICSYMLRHRLKSAYLGIKLMDEEGIRGCLGQNFSWHQCLHKNYIDLNCFAHTRNQLNEMKRLWGYYFDESINRLVDWDFILRMTKNEQCKYLSLFLVNYYCGNKGERITRSMYTKPNELKYLKKYIQKKHKMTN